MSPQDEKKNMTLPNFLIIGAARCGTTSYYEYLKQHPSVFMSAIKETNFFALDREGVATLAWGSPVPNPVPVRSLAEYRRLFCSVTEETAVGEASPLYLESATAPQRIRETLPEVKLIVSLRHPVERAWAGYWMAVQQKTESRTVDEAFGDEEDRVQLGFYHVLLRRYYELFGRERIRVLLFEELETKPLASVRGLFRFLGVDDEFTPDVTIAHGRTYAGAAGLGRRVGGAVVSALPPALRRALRSRGPESVSRYPPLPAKLRERLGRLYRGDLLRLQELIQRDLGAWIADTE